MAGWGWTWHHRHHHKTHHTMNLHYKDRYRARGTHLLLSEPLDFCFWPLLLTWVCQKDFFSRQHHLSLSTSQRGQREEVAGRPLEAVALSLWSLNCLPPAVPRGCPPDRVMTSDTSAQSQCLHSGLRVSSWGPGGGGGVLDAQGVWEIAYSSCSHLLNTFICYFLSHLV